MNKSDIITQDHGGGGKLSYNLISEIILPSFDNPCLSKLDDGASLNIKGEKIAFSTDSYTVDPIFFPGGNIGDLSVNGTVNDISMCGAAPLYLSAALIIEEGFLISDLKKIAQSMSKAANKAGVKIVTGDTKVVPKGAADKIFINTAGIGFIPKNINISGHNAAPGDKIILSGTIADHGVTILTQRKGISFDTNLKSDSAALNKIVEKIVSVSNNIHTLRDPTRGGVSAVLNEIAIQSKIGIKIYEDKIPVKKEAAGICEMLGLDPLYIANEGKFIIFVVKQDADKILAEIKRDKLGQDAVIIGEAVLDHPGKVIMETKIGGTRIIDMPLGEQLPRIC
ncbi:MAG: hydrogenase expression/formation protein HypE [Deltaproteobacteria bacterium]|nr:hydrogenase expression/formation protein HypE [Deltaproteobacteria bacterium]